jgi:lipoprotein-anchoring transpeptidase ErfK/SrfK
VGTAYESYEKLKKVREFPVLTGDDETTTDPGMYVVRVKVPDYYSRKYQTPMPLYIFFNYTERAAIHEGEVPSPRKKIGLATHGCVHVEEPHISWLYDWTERQNPGGYRGRRTGLNIGFQFPPSPPGPIKLAEGVRPQTSRKDCF